MFDLVKLGKRPARRDARTLRMSEYVSILAAPPARVDWSRGFDIDWGMMLNDNLGICTEAGKGHSVQTCSLNTGRLITPPDSAILSAYETECGYVPGDPSTDQGGDELSVLNLTRKNGFAGFKLLAYSDPAPQVALHVMQAIQLFGGVYIGVQLPAAMQGQSSWFVPTNDSLGDTTPGSWGGHCVWVVGYDQYGLTCITWGKLLRMTWDFWYAYCDESHALLWDVWLRTGSVNPDDVSVADLLADSVLVSN